MVECGQSAIEAEVGQWATAGQGWGTGGVRETSQQRWPLCLEVSVEVHVMKKLEMTLETEETATANAQKHKETRYILEKINLGIVEDELCEE